MYSLTVVRFIKSGTSWPFLKQGDIMTQVEPLFYFRNECNHPDSSLVLRFSYEPRVGCVEIVLDYQAGAGEKRDFRRWKFNGVRSMTCDGTPWEGTHENWQACTGENGQLSLASVYSLSVSPVRAVSGAIVAHKLDLDLDKSVSSVTFTFTSVSVQQRFGIAFALEGGKTWTYRDATSGNELNFYDPFPDEDWGL